ncbi:MAG: amidohydrolase family protein [Coriobacteriales bacterium]
MLGECHAHIALDGADFARARALHANGPDEGHIRACLEAHRERGITFVRDGGDAWGVSLRAAQLAPEYGIDYRTPAFAIHRAGRYGSIVGRAFEDMRGYAALVEEAAGLGADFIKIMTTGILDFGEFGKITSSPLVRAEVREMVRVAHEQGLAVMSHTNGKAAVLDAIEAGADSIEHANYIDGECIEALAGSRTCLVPTIVAVRNNRGAGEHDASVVERICELARENAAHAIEAGCLIALGSDAGVAGVPHGQGVRDEYEILQQAVPDRAQLDAALARGQAFIAETFQRR